MPKYIVRMTENHVFIDSPLYVGYLDIGGSTSLDKKNKDVVRLTVCKNNAQFMDALCEHLNRSLNGVFNEETGTKRLYERVLDE
jgi:hypothetical protein